MRTPVLSDSIPFDVYAWKDYKGLQPLFDELWKEMPKDKCKKKTLGRLNTTLKLFLCNLFVAHCKTAPVAISFKADMYSHGRYKALHFRRIPFQRVFAFFNEKQLVYTKKGVKFFEKQNNTKNNMEGYLSRIWPSDLLTQRFNSLKVVISQDHESSNLIILRDNKGNDITTYKDTYYIKSLRLNITHINKVNSSYKILFNPTYHKEYIPNNLQDNHSIDINYLYNSDYINNSINNESSTHNNSNTSNLITTSTINNNQLLNQQPTSTITTTLEESSSQLREPNVGALQNLPACIKAVFSNSSFEQGGRFYAVHPKINWQSMPLEQRKTILIDGLPVEEWDYSAFHISILYAARKIQLEGDPYTLDGYDKEMRPIIKKLFLTVLNASTTGEAVISMNTQVRQLRKKDSLSKRDFKFLETCIRWRPDFREMIEALRRTHKPIADSFCSGAGIYLQRVDALIMEKILVSMTGKDIPCLPIHDSVIVAGKYAPVLVEEMDKAYKSVLGKEFSCRIEKK